MIGILPAAGNASRIHGLPKFLLPVGDTYLLKRHVEMMRIHITGIPLTGSVYVGSNPMRYISLLEQSNATYYVYVAAQRETMTQTVLSFQDEWHYSERALTLFGMPDTYIEDDHCYAKLAAEIADCDVAVGVFYTRPEQRSKLGMVALGISGAVLSVIDKPENTTYTLAWGVLAWKPIFWQHLKPEMPHVGYGLMPAIEAGLNVRAVMMEGQYFDCGTPDEYFDLIVHLHGEKIGV